MTVTPMGPRAIGATVSALNEKPNSSPGETTSAAGMTTRQTHPLTGESGSGFPVRAAKSAVAQPGGFAAEADRRELNRLARGNRADEARQEDLRFGIPILDRRGRWRNTGGLLGLAAQILPGVDGFGVDGGQDAVLAAGRDPPRKSMQGLGQFIAVEDCQRLIGFVLREELAGFERGLLRLLEAEHPFHLVEQPFEPGSAATGPGEELAGARLQLPELLRAGILARPPAEGHALSLPGAAHPAIAHLIEFRMNRGHLLGNRWGIGAPGVLTEEFLRREAGLPGVVNQESEVLLDVTGAPMNAQDALAAALLGVAGHVRVSMNIRLRMPLVAIQLQPGNRPALALRRQGGVGPVNAGPRPNVVKGRESDAGREQLVEAVVVFSREQPLIAAPAGDGQARRLPAVRQRAERQPGELLQPGAFTRAGRAAGLSVLVEGALPPSLFDGAAKDLAPRQAVVFQGAAGGQTGRATGGCDCGRHSPAPLAFPAARAR